MLNVTPVQPWCSQTPVWQLSPGRGGLQDLLSPERSGPGEHQQGGSRVMQGVPDPVRGPTAAGHHPSEPCSGFLSPLGVCLGVQGG